MAASSRRARSPRIPIPRVSPTSSRPPSITSPRRPPVDPQRLAGQDAGRRRGSDDFVELPWDEALDIAAHEIDRVAATHGNEAIFGGSYGWASAGRFHHAQSQAHRFLNCIGGYVASFGSYSTGCAQSIMPHVFGVDFLTMLYEHQDGWPTIHDHTETLVMFGGINAKNAQVSMGGITEHETRGWFERFAEKGMRCVNIGPQRSDAPESCDWMPVRPGSDTALMLALAYVLEEEGLANRDFLDSHTVGYERFRPYLMGETDGVPKSPDWAGPICGAAAEDIRALARRMATTRTLITVAWSLQRASMANNPTGCPPSSPRCWGRSAFRAAAWGMATARSAAWANR
jgi:biotin/methionine sulfoxide reductase